MIAVLIFIANHGARNYSNSSRPQALKAKHEHGLCAERGMAAQTGTSAAERMVFQVVCQALRET